MAEPDRVIALLQTFAEIAAAFAGFAALVSIFRGSAPQERQRVFAIANVVLISLSAIAVSMLAAVLLAHVSPELTWRLSSGVFAAGWLTGTVTGMSGYASIAGGSLRRDTPALFATSLSATAIGVCLLLWNAVDPGPGASLRYLLALLVLLGIAAHMFVVAVFGPGRAGLDPGRS